MPSAVISSISYDSGSETLIITYISGAVYHYKDVPETIYRTLRASGSKGRYLNHHIKGKYACVRV